MDRTSLIVVILCVLLLVFWGPIARYLGFASDPEPVTQQEVGTDTVNTQTAPSQAFPQDTLEQPEYMTALTDDTLVSPMASLAEETITITSPLYNLTFSNRGGGLKVIELRKFQYMQNGGNVVMEAAEQHQIVPDIETAGGSYKAEKLMFATDDRPFDVTESSGPRTITYTHDNGQGGRIIKAYTIYPDKYKIDLEVVIESIETFGFERSYNLVWDITPPPTEADIKDDYKYFNVVAYQNDYRELDDYDNNELNEYIPGETKWAGIRTKYFAVAMIPRTRSADAVKGEGSRFNILVDDKKVQAKKLEAELEMAMTSVGSVSDRFELYVGPIDYSRLHDYEVGLEELSSLGWVIIKPFSIAIIWLLPQIHNVVPNYGIVVLIFALLVKLITYPLSRKQAVAMARMRELSPKMQELQAKYKNDPQKLNKAMMKLYKEAGANPLSGCLPLLPQMPLFFALFTVFRTTIEFRGAGFVGWITDLSTPDPFYVLPIIMVITMFVQQKMTMTDPKNKMMAYILPLVFGWLFISFPSGLVLYWTGFNVLSLLELIFVRKQTEKKDKDDAVVVATR